MKVIYQRGRPPRLDSVTAKKLRRLDQKLNDLNMEMIDKGFGRLTMVELRRTAREQPEAAELVERYDRVSEQRWEITDFWSRETGLAGWSAR